MHSLFVVGDAVQHGNPCVCDSMARGLQLNTTCGRHGFQNECNVAALRDLDGIYPAEYWETANHHRGVACLHNSSHSAAPLLVPHTKAVFPSVLNMHHSCQ